MEHRLTPFACPIRVIAQQITHANESWPSPTKLHLINTKGLTKPQKSKPFKLRAGTAFPNSPGCSMKGSGTSTPKHPTLAVIKPGCFKALFGACVVLNCDWVSQHRLLWPWFPWDAEHPQHQGL